MELTREVLERLKQSCGAMGCRGCKYDADMGCKLPTVQEVSAYALSLMDERDRLRMQVRAAEDVIAKAAAVISADTDAGLAALCAMQAWQITPTEMYYRNEAEMEAANAEAGQ